MANLVDDSGDATSNLVAGNGTNSARFTMPGNVALSVESVVATINNASGGDTGATLVVRDQSGVVIATKRQGAVIPAGDTGTATWALRDDDNDAVGTAAGFVKYNFENTGDYLDIFSHGTSPDTGMGFYVETDTDAQINAFNGDLSMEATTMRIEGDSTLDLASVTLQLLPGQNGAVIVKDVTNGKVIEARHVQASAGSWVRLIPTATNAATGFAFDVTASGPIGLSAQGNVDISALGASKALTVHLGASGKVEVRDSTNAAIFRVNEDGSLQGKTGKALTFNL